MDALEIMKAELEIMRYEKIYMEALLSSAETVIEEHKRVISMCKAMAKLADDLLGVVLEAGVDENTTGQELDEDTIKELVEEAMGEFNQALNQAQSRWSSPAQGGNTTGGGDGNSGDYHSIDRTNISTGKEARGSGGGHKGGNGGGHA